MAAADATLVSVGNVPHSTSSFTPPDFMPELTAYHEAGHAFMAICLGGRVRSVTITPDNDDGPERFGDTQIEWDRGQHHGREFTERLVAVALAGPVAEAIHREEPFHPGFVAAWADDWQQAWTAASGLFADEQQRMKYLEQVTAQLYEELRDDNNWAALAAIVDSLLAHEWLEGDEVTEIVATWM